jgi:hypothetical protein
MRNAGAGPAPWGSGIGPAPLQVGEVILESRLPPVLTRTYHGKPGAVAMLQGADAEALAKRHYYPSSQSYVEGRWSGVAWVLALLACLFLVGILILFYMLADKPAGDLTVIYERRLPQSAPSAQQPIAAPAPAPAGAAAPSSATKKCPDCAEAILADARICRFCRYEFAPRP